MNNDKTKSRPEKEKWKERWRGRKCNEKAIQLCRNVCRWLCLNQLWRALVICCVVTIAVFRNLRDSAFSWLANQENAEMERIK